jgi:hypothetical protein
MRQNWKPLRLSFAFLLILVPCFCFSQETTTTAPAELESLKAAIQTDRTAVDALVLYPPEIGQAIFEASTYPEVVAKLASIQSASSGAFRKYLEGLSKEDQASLYELNRYPGLIEALANARGSQPSILSVVEKRSKDIGDVALRIGSSPDKVPILVNISGLNRSVKQVLDQLLQSYSAEAQAAFQTLIAHPETLSILTDHMSLTVQLGAFYKKDPAYAKDKSSAAHATAIQNSANMLEAWKSELEKNAAAIQELQASASSYAEGRGYDMSTAFAAPGPEDVEMNPYPYWSGYPFWYTEPRWYPVPPHYDWGWFLDRDRAINVVGLPSYAFVHWVLEDPVNVEAYPHLTDLFLTHYEQHPDATDSLTKTVGAWLETQKELVPAKWFNNDGNRAARLKEYGHLLLESGAGSLSSVQREEYIEVHGDSYPGLNFKLESPTATISTETPPNIKFQSPSGRRMYYWAVDYQLSSWTVPYHQNVVTISVPIGKK